jgi:hypothetical protein
MPPKIEKNIKELVKALNAHGIATTGSCEGHMDHGSPAPWVKVVPRKNAATTRKNILACLKLFYKNHRASKDMRIVIEKAKSGFWIHNGGSVYISWRKSVNKIASEISRGKVPTVGPRQNKRSVEKLSRYQQEIKTFAAFLNQY